MKFKCLFSLLLVLSINSVSADMFAPSPSCTKPYKPYKFNDQYEITNFKNQVEEYRQCINDFVEEQNNAIVNHRHAAEEATSEWDNYVNYELQ